MCLSLYQRIIGDYIENKISLMLNSFYTSSQQMTYQAMRSCGL